MAHGFALLATVLALITALPGSATGVVSPRVVGGAGVAITDFPFQAALYDPRASSVSAGFFCGGVIINATHVVTAAHCAVDEATGRVTSPRDIAVLAGSSSLGSAVQSPSGATAVQDPAAATSIDPSYDPAINDYDVAVITLARPLWSGPTPPVDGRSAIAPIQVSAALASAYAAPTVSAAPIFATVSGWGDTRPEPPSSQGLGGAYPSGLQATELPLVASATCGNTYTDPLSSQPITPRMLCAGFPGGGHDSCFGDSGGPLVVDRDVPARPPYDYVLAGLVSFGEGCAQAESPGVYAAIADPAIAAFLNSDPPQTPLGQSDYARRFTGIGARPGAGHPTLTVVAKSCAHRGCTVNVLASDPPAGAGVRTVHAVLGLHRRAVCLRRGRRVQCTRTASRAASVRAMPSQHFLILADRLARGSYTLQLTAIDRAGRRQLRPTTVALLVR